MRTNAGYVITNSCCLGENKEVVIGANANGYVTWLCKNGNDYFWGHYFNTYKEAMIDFGNRIASEAEWIEEESLC